MTDDRSGKPTTHIIQGYDTHVLIFCSNRILPRMGALCNRLHPLLLHVLIQVRRLSGSIPRVPGGPDPSGEPQGPKAGSMTTGTAASAGTTTTTLARSPKTYPLLVVLIVALIAFLVGSLLSPADFIYVVTEVNAGWRQIRRLVEVKIVGGWAFQIAVVRGIDYGEPFSFFCPLIDASKFCIITMHIRE